MASGSYRSIRQKIIGAVALVLVLLALLLYGQVESERATILRSAEKGAASYTSALKEHGERVFTEADNALRTIADTIADHGGVSFIRSARFQRLLSDAAKSGPQFSSVFFVDVAGTIVVHSQESGLKPVDVSDRDYFVHHRDRPDSGLFISRPFTSRVSGTSRFALSRALRAADGRLQGVLVVTYETGYFQKLYQSMDVGRRGRIILSSTTGDILIIEPRGNGVPEGFAASTLFTSRLGQAASGTFQDMSRTGSDMRLISYSRFDHYPVVAIVSLSQADLMERWRVSALRQGGFVLLLMAVIVLVVRLSLRQFGQLETVNRQLEQHQDELQLANEAIEKMMDPVYWIRPDGRIMRVNAAAAAALGYTREELCALRIPDIDPLVDERRWQEHWQELVDSGSVRLETQHRRKDGAVLDVEVVANLVVSGGQQLNCATVRDISERKQGAKQLAMVAREWQETFDAAADAVWLLDMQRTIIRANRSTEPIFGLSPGEVVGRRCCEIAHQAAESHAECPFDRMLASGRRATMQLQKGGRWYDVSLDPVFDDDGRIVKAVHVVKDITGIKMSELREHVRSEILERIACGSRLDELLGYIARSIEKERPGALCSILLVSEDGKRLLNGAAPSLPAEYNIAVHRTRIGEGIGSCGTAAYRGERVVVEDIASHPFWQGFTPAEAAGLRSCWSEPIRSSSGRILGTFAIYHREPMAPGPEEISLIEQASTFAAIAIERHRAEAERLSLEEQLHQSQKMEAIGHLAGGMAHDFNNLLTPVIVYADLLKRSLSADDTKARAKLDAIVSAAHRARDLTQQLLGFSRKQVMQPKPLDLNEAIRAFCPMIRRTLRENIDIQLKLSAQPLVLVADAAKLDQVLLNLAINAQDAIEDNGSIVIETGQALIDDEYARLHPGVETGSYAMLIFSDSGCGMDEAVLGRIFEPFFSTKPAGHGTGLGLANVYGIIKQHKGHVEVQSAPGKGTAFKLFLPSSDQAALAVGERQSGPALDHSGSETILLVEDNEMVRELIGELLGGLGYAVHIADGPDRALEMARELGEEIDLLISDIVMPGMDGTQLYSRLQEEGHEIGAVLYISGYTNNVTTNAIIKSGEHLLLKPFNVDEFMGKVRELLARDAEPSSGAAG